MEWLWRLLFGGQAMAEHRYNRVKSTIWFRIAKHDDMTRELILYLMTCRHNNILGCYYLPISYVCEDLKWFKNISIGGQATVSAPDIERAGRLLVNIIDDGLISYDFNSQVVLLKSDLIEYQIENGNQVKAAIKQLLELPKTYLLLELKPLLERLAKPLLEPLISKISETFNEEPAPPIIEEQTVATEETSPPTPEEEPKQPDRPKNPKYSFEVCDMTMAKFFRTEVLKAHPTVKVPEEKEDKLAAWADVFRKIRKLDNKGSHEVAVLIKWVHEKSEFWSKNILSAETFREKYDRLLADMNVKGSANHGNVKTGGDPTANTGKWKSGMSRN
jgi:hypothetical protein